jgi:hypothetical protein
MGPPVGAPPTMQNWHRIVGDHVDFRRRHSLASPLSLCPLPRRLANFLGRCVRSCATQISLHMTLHCNWVRPDSGLVGSDCLYSREAMALETPRCVSPRLRWPISGQDLLPSTWPIGELDAGSIVFAGRTSSGAGAVHRLRWCS